MDIQNLTVPEKHKESLEIIKKQETGLGWFKFQKHRMSDVVSDYIS